jgi:cytochrome c oxidase cbb3-type subunit 3
MFQSGLHSVPPNLERGALLFSQSCASCHGADGRGLKDTKRANFTDPVWHVGKQDRDIAQTIVHGRPPRMPPMAMGETQLRDLVGYLRSLKQGEAPSPNPASTPQGY